jgi:hypothetical protein
VLCWVTETGISATGLVFYRPNGRPTHRFETATMTLTLTYLYGAAPDHLSVTILALGAPVPTSPDWPPGQVDPDGSYRVDLPVPAKAGPKTYTLVVTVMSGTNLSDFRMRVRGMAAGNVALSEANPYNTSTPVHVRVVT